jgi:hypothetical protein
MPLSLISYFCTMVTACVVSMAILNHLVTRPGPTMTPEDLAALRTAVRVLEHPGLAARLTNLVGKPIDLIIYALPVAASRAIATATAKVSTVSKRILHHARHAREECH